VQKGYQNYGLYVSQSDKKMVNTWAYVAAYPYGKRRDAGRINETITEGGRKKKEKKQIASGSAQRGRRTLENEMEKGKRKVDLETRKTWGGSRTKKEYHR